MVVVLFWFCRHGRVQSVKFLGEDGRGGKSGGGATVAFIDVRSATKALRAVHSMAGQPLHIQYHEPGSAVVGSGGRTSSSSVSSVVHGVVSVVSGGDCGAVSGSSPGGDSLPGSSSGHNDCSGVTNSNSSASTNHSSGSVGVLASVVVAGGNVNSGSNGTSSSSNGPTTTPGAGSGNGGGVYRRGFNVQLG